MLMPIIQHPNISKMIVLSTSDFLDPTRLGNEQLDFVKNSTYWLLGREELIGIGREPCSDENLI